VRNVTWGFILVVIGVLLLLNNLDIADMGDIIQDYWPMILILWGISILTRRRQSTNTESPVISSSSTSQQFTGDLIHESTVFGDQDISITSQNFKGGSISSVFGDSHIDLSKAVIAEGEHHLRVHSVFGDSIIILPREAAVSISATSTFGDLHILGQKKGGISIELQVTSENYSSSSKRLQISSSKVFGDLRVI
jgi:predicted membrane protein